MGTFLTKDILITRVSNNVAAGSSNINSNCLAMDGYDGVTFMASISTVVNNANIALVVQNSNTNTNASMTAITGATTTTTNSDGTTINATNTDLIVEVYRPLKEFVNCQLQIATQNVTVLGIWAIQWRAKEKPTGMPTVAATPASGASVFCCTSVVGS